MVVAVATVVEAMGARGVEESVGPTVAESEEEAQVCLCSSLGSRIPEISGTSTQTISPPLHKLPIRTRGCTRLVVEGRAAVVLLAAAMMAAAVNMVGGRMEAVAPWEPVARWAVATVAETAMVAEELEAGETAPVAPDGEAVEVMAKACLVKEAAAEVTAEAVGSGVKEEAPGALGPLAAEAMGVEALVDGAKVVATVVALGTEVEVEEAWALKEGGGEGVGAAMGTPKVAEAVEKVAEVQDEEEAAGEG